MIKKRSWGWSEKLLFERDLVMTGYKWCPGGFLVITRPKESSIPFHTMEDDMTDYMEPSTCLSFLCNNVVIMGFL